VYRQAVVDFIFHRIDVNNRGYLGETELTYYFRDFSSPKERTFAVFRFFNCHNSNRRIPYSWALDHYITHSMSIGADDAKFKSDLFQFWSITDVAEADQSIAKIVAENANAKPADCKHST
jgi:hypothetical protein